MCKNGHRESRHWKMHTEGRELIVLIERKYGGQREGARGFLLGWASFQSGIPLLDSLDLRFPCAVNHIVGTK